MTENSGTTALDGADDAEPEVDLGALFRPDASTKERLLVVHRLIKVAQLRLKGARAVAGQSGAFVAEHSARLLTELAARVPVRTAEALTQACGSDPEVQARRVVDDAARLAGILGRVPTPPSVGAIAVEVAKVVGRCVIELRMVGELYAVYGAARVERDRAWLNTVLCAWALRVPVRSSGSAASNTVALARRIQELVKDDLGVATHNSGANTSEKVRRLGQSMQRRMRLHPSAWLQPAAQTTGEVLRHAMWGEIATRVPAPVASVIRHVAKEAGPDAGAPSATSPQQALALAWSLHQVAISNANRLPALEPATHRLSSALIAQRGYLDHLSRQLGQPGPPDSTMLDGARAAATTAAANSAAVHSAGVHSAGVNNTVVTVADTSLGVWGAEEAIDLVETLGSRPRRLSAWSSRGRAALTYLFTALATSTLAGAGQWAAGGVARYLLLAAQILLLPWLSLTIGVGLVGSLFKPWIGGRVPRHWIVGTLIAFAIHVTVAVATTVLILAL